MDFIYRFQIFKWVGETWQGTRIVALVLVPSWYAPYMDWLICFNNLGKAIYDNWLTSYDKYWVSNLGLITVHKLSDGSITHCHIIGLEQNCSNSIANALELLQFCTKLSIYDRPCTVDTSSEKVIPTSVHKKSRPNDGEFVTDS